MAKSCKIPRRRFLKCAGGALAGVAWGFPAIIPASALGADGAVAPSNRISLGFIGLGTEGRLKNLKRFMAQPDVQVLALCDVHETRLRSAHMAMQAYAREPSAAAYRSCLTTGDWRDIIARKDIDAVVVSTPDHWHVPIAVAAANAGKDVFCEKPMSLTIREGRILSDVIKQRSRIFMTGTELRSLPNMVRLWELVRNGRIGKVHTIRTEIFQNFGGTDVNPPFKTMPIPKDFNYDMWLGQAPDAPYTKPRCHNTFRYILDYAGGTLTDWGSHFNDIAQWANGTDRTGPISVEGHGRFAEGGLFNSAIEWELTYQYANGVTLICKSAIDASIRVEGTDGWVQCPWATFETSSAKIAKSEIGADEVHARTCAGGEQRDFLDCVKSREETYAPAEVGHRTATICHMGNIALQLGRKLQWNPDTEQFLNDDEANKKLSRSMRSPWTLET